MPTRLIIIISLLLATLGSYWMLHQVMDKPQQGAKAGFHDPDYYLEDFTILSMGEDGRPKNKLYAVYMAHYPHNDTAELLQPEMEIFRDDKPPLFVRSEKGRATNNNKVIVLQGQVQMWRDDEFGIRTLQVDTSEAKVSVEEDYVETGQYASIRLRRTTITGTGMRAYLNDNRLEVTDHEKTIITAEH